MLVDGVAAIIELKFERALCIERYADFKQLGRFTLRHKGKTLAAGIILDYMATNEKTMEERLANVKKD